jgi:X-X-X-Leu-X-X-Gly heptad repeat protein
VYPHTLSGHGFVGPMEVRVPFLQLSECGVLEEGRIGTVYSNTSSSGVTNLSSGVTNLSSGVTNLSSGVDG